MPDVPGHVDVDMDTRTEIDATADTELPELPTQGGPLRGELRGGDVSLPSNPLPPTPEPYQPIEGCWRDKFVRRWPDGGHESRFDHGHDLGLKSRHHGVVHSSKFPRSMSEERNAAVETPADEKLYSDALYVEGAWVPARMSPICADLFLWKAKPRSVWHPPRERA